MLSAHDWYTTFASLAGASDKVPTSVKWHNIKVVLRYSEGIDQPIVTPQRPMLFDLASDARELYNLMATKMDMGWMLGLALKFVADYQKSISQYPNIKTGEEFAGYPPA